MAKRNKEQTQIILLVAVLCIIVGVLIFNYRAAFVPASSGDLGLFAIPVRPVLPTSLDTSVFDRRDFPSGTVSAETLTPSDKGVDNPFTTR